MGMNISISITQNSQKIANNTSNVTVVVTGRWDYGSYNKNQCPGTLTIDGVDYKFFSPFNWNCTTTGTQELFAKTVDVAHNSDGTKTLKCSASYETGVSTGTSKASASKTLTAIPRAASITSAGNVTLGNACSVKWTPAAASHRYKLKFSLGTWSYTTGAIHPNKTTAYTYTGYTIALDVASQISDAKTGAMTVTLYTYSDSGASTQIGSASSKTFTVTVPDNSNTKPAVSMSLAPVGTLPSTLAGLYIQGLTKVKATLGAEGKYSATIKSYTMKVDGVSYGSEDDMTSGFLANAGTRTVYGYATDSRGYIGEKAQDITVLAYSNPKLLDTSAYRCDKDGNATDSGTYLKIQAKRSYSPLAIDGEQKNFCKIQYRYGRGESYTEWVTILEGSSLDTDAVTTGALLDGVLSTLTSYMVHIRAIDDVGRYAESYIAVPTEKVYMHRDGARNSMGLGKYVEEDNLLDVAWDAHFRGEVKIGDTGMTLREYILAVISEGG